MVNLIQFVPHLESQDDVRAVTSTARKGPSLVFKAARSASDPGS